MLKKQMVKKTSLFTLILAFLAIGTTANASVMNNEKGKDGEKEKVVKTTIIAAQWFEYTGPAFGSPGYDPMDQENYTPRGSSSPSCSGSNSVCAIHAEGEVISSPTPKVVPTNAELSALSSDIQNNNPVPNRLELKN